MHSFALTSGFSLNSAQVERLVPQRSAGLHRCISPELSGRPAQRARTIHSTVGLQPLLSFAESIRDPNDSRSSVAASDGTEPARIET